ncbi:MAG: ABC transporter ATP-binding protein, partial [Pseudobutyrivibrio sp.]|nr:ABC transporter ATP-binding protein [Pseudobutyrivibrio sp.]
MTGDSAVDALDAPDKFTATEDFFIETFGRNSTNSFKTLLGLYKGQYWRLFLSAVFFVLKHACVWVLPVVTANVINIALTKDITRMPEIIANITVLAFLVVLNFPSNYLYTKFRSTAVRYVEAGLRGALVRKMQQLSITYHTEMQSGRLQSKVMRDVEAIETLSQQLFTNVITIALNIFVALFVTGMRSKTVLLFFVICGPVAAATMWFFRKQIKSTNKDFRREMEETSAQVMEMVEMIPVTRAHALENQEIDKMERQLNHVAKAGYRLDVVQANFGAVGWCIFQLFQVMCLGFTGYLALKGRTTVGDITLYQTYFSTIVNQITSFINLMPIIAKGFESVNSVGEILLAPDVEDNRGKLKLKKVEGEFEFKDVHFAYDGEHAV